MAQRIKPVYSISIASLLLISLIFCISTETFGAGAILVGDIIAEVSGQSVRGLAFERVTAILHGGSMRGAAVHMALFRPSSNSNQLIHVSISS